MKKFLRSTSREISQEKTSKKTKNRSVFLNLAVCCLVGIVGVFYLIETNEIAIQGYKVGDLQKKITELQAANQNLELKTVELRSLVNLEKKIIELQMVKIDQAVHIDQANPAVAFK